MEQDEFTTVYRQFYGPLYVYALSLSGNRSDAEDLVVYFHLSDEEIGRSMGITKENVRQIRSRAKKQVMRLLEVKDHEGF